MRLKPLLFVFVALVISNFVSAQTVQNPTVTAAIHQKYDHTPTYPGFDTVVLPGIGIPMITLSSNTFVPVRRFNGLYNVEQIPYSPVDTNYGCSEDSVVTEGMIRWDTIFNGDDRFLNHSIVLPFIFNFFGLPKTAFVPGSNGMITFNTLAAGQFCPYNSSDAGSLPWSSGEFLSNANMHDAIFGVYEDTYPELSMNRLPRGLYYGVVGEYPSRKFVFSVKDITQYPSSSNPYNRCTYQIVGYENTNVIEVHVKRRSLSSTGWNGNRGYIGIINETGLPQQPSDTNPYVLPDAPAAFYPEGYNPTTQAFNNTSFRFSPQGTGTVSSAWYRVFDDGREPVQLTTDPMDTNGYVALEVGDDMTDPSLTRISIRPTCHSRYVHEFNFMDANNNLHHLYDTIRVGYLTVTEFDTIISDTTITSDTIQVNDTVWIHDTAWVYSSFVVYDTLYVHDTVPLYIYDTVYIHDTVYVGVNDVQTVNVKMYAADGQIVVEGSDGMAVMLYDAVGRLLATRNDGLSMQRFNVPTSGAYMVKVGKYPARRVVVVK